MAAVCYIIVMNYAMQTCMALQDVSYDINYGVVPTLKNLNRMQIQLYLTQMYLHDSLRDPNGFVLRFLYYIYFNYLYNLMHNKISTDVVMLYKLSTVPIEL